MCCRKICSNVEHCSCDVFITYLIFSYRLRKLKISPKRIFMGLFPIIQWSKTYSSEKAIGDLIAGITIALTLIPQSIAYASLAGFEPQVLYLSRTVDNIYAWSPVSSIVPHGRTRSMSKALAMIIWFMEGNSIWRFN